MSGTTKLGRFGIALTVVSFLGFASISGAATTVVVIEDLTTTHDVIGITGFSTLGSDMAGMDVTGIFSDGSFVTATWVGGAGGSGFASGLDAGTGLGFNLSLTGDTFTAPWTLLNTSGDAEIGLTALLIDGFPGDTVFDRTFDDSEGTPFSALGADFNTSFTLPFDFTVTALYADPVGVGGVAPVGDLFRFLLVDLGIPGGLLNTDGEFIFTADTDNIGLPPGQVAEPGSLLLLGAGLLGLLYRRRR